jgi:large subunit ribosomal protein L25
MEQIELKAEVRETTGKHVKRVRAAGYVPAVLYGSHIQATPIQIESKAAHKALARAGGNTLIKLQVGDNEPVLTLAREVQRHYIHRHILHADFHQVVMTEKISADVPLRLTGEAPAVKELGGILVHGLDRVQVECLPGDLPAFIEVDLSSLAKLHDAVAVAGLRLPPGITVLAAPETVIAHVEAPRKAEEEVVVEEAAPAEVEPELVRKRAEKEEGVEAE